MSTTLHSSHAPSCNVDFTIGATTDCVYARELVCTDALQYKRTALQFTCFFGDESSYIRIEQESNNKFIHGSLANFRLGFIFLVMPCWLTGKLPAPSLSLSAFKCQRQPSIWMRSGCMYVSGRSHWLCATRIPPHSHTIDTRSHIHECVSFRFTYTRTKLAEHMQVVSIARAINKMNAQNANEKKNEKRLHFGEIGKMRRRPLATPKPKKRQTCRICASAHSMDCYRVTIFQNWTVEMERRYFSRSFRMYRKLTGAIWECELL